MSITIVHNLLDEKLATVTGLPSLAKENIKHVIKAGEEYSRSTLLPRESVELNVGIHGTTELGGLYQIDLFYRQNTGTDDANLMADAVVATFNKGANLTNGTQRVQINTAWREAAYAMGNYYAVPVVVRWTSFISNI